MQRSSAFPYHALSVLVILISDWLVYGFNMLTRLREPILWVVLGAAVAAVAVGLTEWRLRGTTRGLALFKAMLAAIIVAVPLPLGGSVLFGFALSWWLIAATARVTNQLGH